MRRVDAHEPLAAALQDHWEGGTPVCVTCVRGEGFSYEIDTRSFFDTEGPDQGRPDGARAKTGPGEAEGRGAAGGRRETAREDEAVAVRERESTAPTLDRVALEQARGRVLDVGAGAGRHALALQAAGHELVAIDVSERCVALMRRRGVRHCHALDAFALGTPEALRLGRFDTILLLMQSLGIAGSGFGVEVLLGKLAALLAPGGQILADSSPLAGTPDGRDGELEVHFEYGDLRGDTFSWIYLDERALERHAAASGLRCDILAREGEAGEYLARLTPDPAAGEPEPHPF